MTSDGDAPSLPPAPAVVVFDIGEVLIDETRVWSVWAEIVGVSPLTFAAVLGAAVSQGYDHEAVFAMLAPNVEWRALSEEHEARYGGFTEADLYPDVRPCLAALRTAGLRVVLAGNQPARRSAQLEALDLPVDDIVTSDELQAEKPDPSFFAAVLDRVGATAPDTVLYVGDRVDNDVLPAAAAGMSTCWIQRGPWGVLQDLEDDDCDLALAGLGELPTLLADWASGGDASG